MASLTKNRIESVDLLKGLVMVIMALDHTRDFFYKSPGVAAVTDPNSVTAALYITRWVTHFCAPTFCFLAGISACFVGRRKSKPELSKFLVQRGAWLVLIAFTLINFVWYFDFSFHNFDIDVIWMLGMCMLFLAALIYLPRNYILVFSCLLIFGHNLLDYVHFEGNILWSVIHEFNSFNISDEFQINVIYPLVPWIGVMSLGYYFGEFYDSSLAPEKRKKLFTTIGVTAFIGFFIIRFVNIYGDKKPWQPYESASQTIMSFMNVNKYPPSLLYLAITLSMAFIFLANSEKWKGKVVDFFTVFGRVPFFYYIIHLYAIHLLAMLLAEVGGYGWRVMVQDTFDPDLKGFGYSLPVVYLVWIGIILSLYPLCKWFDRYKQNHKERWWLSYL